MLQDQPHRDVSRKMSETASTNDVPESNGAMEQPAYNGEAEEHAGTLTHCVRMTSTKNGSTSRISYSKISKYIILITLSLI